MRTGWKFIALVVAIFSSAISHAAEEEAVMDEIIVEAPFDLRLQLPNESHVEIMIDRLTLKAEMARALELEVANRTPLNVLLDLTKYSPIHMGSSDSRIDTYFTENFMRADLNPRIEDPLTLRH